MHRKPSEMEALLPSGVPYLEDLAREVISLGGPWWTAPSGGASHHNRAFLLLGIPKGDLR